MILKKCIEIHPIKLNQIKILFLHCSYNSVKRFTHKKNSWKGNGPMKIGHLLRWWDWEWYVIPSKWPLLIEYLLRTSWNQQEMGRLNHRRRKRPMDSSLHVCAWDLKTAGRAVAFPYHEVDTQPMPTWGWGSSLYQLSLAEWGSHFRTYFLTLHVNWSAFHSIN